MCYSCCEKKVVNVSKPADSCDLSFQEASMSHALLGIASEAAGKVCLGGLHDVEQKYRKNHWMMF